MKKLEITQTEYKDAFDVIESEIKKELTNDVNTLVSNGNLMAFLLDHINCPMPEVKYEKDENGKIKHLYAGQFQENVSMYIDPLMMWDDHRIIFKNDDSIVNEIEIIDENALI